MSSIWLSQYLSVFQIQKLLGLMVASIIPLGLLHIRQFQFWLKSKGFHPLKHLSRMIRVMHKGFIPFICGKDPSFVDAVVVKYLWSMPLVEWWHHSESLFASEESTHCPLWFALTPPAPLGLDTFAQMWPRLCQDTVHLLLLAPFWPAWVWFSDQVFLLEERSAGVDLSPSPRKLETSGLAKY